MKAKCLMLDVDGVLVEGRQSDGKRWDAELLNDLGMHPQILAEHFFLTEWNDIVVGKKALLPTLEAVLKHRAPHVGANDLLAYWFEMDSRIVQSVLKDVRAARGQGLAVHLATNQEHLRANYLMQTLGLNDEVDGIVYSAQAGCKKPNHEFFAFAARETGYQPSDLLLVDDTLENVEAARQSGWSAVHWKRTDSLSAILQNRIG